MKNVIITIFSQNYIFFTNLALYMIGKKGASCRKDHGQRKILIHKRKILLSYEQRRGHIGTWVWDERNQVRGISYARRGKRLRGKRQCFAGTFASTCKRLRQRMQTFEAKVANVWGKGCKRLRQRLQTFAAKVANVCGNGCNALRLRWAKLAPKSLVLFWIREKGGKMHL